MIAASHNAVVPVIPILFYLAIGLAVIATIIIQSRARRKRALDLQALATRLGFEDFNPNRDEAFARGWGFLNQLNQGSNRYAYNVLRGTYHERPLFIFDYHYQTGSGKSTRQHELTVLMLVFKEIFPQLSIGPESLGTKIAEVFGVANDIHFESAEFSRIFCVRSPDKKFAYDVCNPQMIDYLLANPGLRVEIQGPVLLLAFEPQLPVGQIEFNLQRLIEIRTRLPEYLFANK